VLQKPVLYISHYLRKNRQAYYDHLQNVRERGDWESWIRFFLRGVTEVSLQAADTARQILELREEHRGRITDHLGYSAASGHRVLDVMYERPILSVKDVREITKTSYAAANNLVSKFVDLNLLKEITGQARNRRFLYESYVHLFQGDGQA
jgi:Fic family protein